MQIRVNHITTAETDGETRTRLDGDVCLRLRCWPDGVDVDATEPDVDETRSQYVKKEGQMPDPDADTPGRKKTSKELMDGAVHIIKKEFSGIMTAYENMLAQISLVDVSAIENDLKAVK